MAPVRLACRLQSTWLFVIFLFLSQIFQYVSTILVYDKQTLFDIRNAVEISINKDLRESNGSFPTPLSTISESLSQLPCAFPGRKRRWRRGKRGGVLIRWKLYLASFAVPHSYPSARRYELVRDRYFPWRCLEPSYCWIRPVVPVFHSIPPKVLLRRGGVDLINLRPLCHPSRSVGDPIVVRMALVNSRSLVNKSFILNDFFTSRGLDFLFVTETWLNVGDLSPFWNLCHRSVRFLILLGLLVKAEDLHQFLKDISAVGHCRLMYTPVLNCSCCKLI